MSEVSAASASGQAPSRYPTLAALRLLGWLEPLDESLARLLGGGDVVVELAVAAVSRCVRGGHVCVPLSELAALKVVHEGAALPALPSAAEFRTALEQSDAVWARSGGESPQVGLRPLVLDESGRLYLHRFFEHEARLARALRRLMAARHWVAEDAADALFPPGACDEDQRAAARSALSGGLTMISGGPGTGKTSTVVRILALLAQRAAAAGQKSPRVLLLAPTGKAAARLRESIRGAKARLSLEPAVARAIAEESSTIHRALGVMRGSRTRFHRREGSALDADVVLVDEASMVDLALMRHLVEALRPGAALILLGDRDQLASVEAGSVLSELCDAEALRDAGPGGGLVQLRRSYRFRQDSAIFSLAGAIRSGQGGEAWAAMRQGGDDVTFVECRTPAFSAALKRLIVDGFSRALAEREPERVFAALGQFRVLTVHRAGPFGALVLNDLCRLWLAQAGMISGTGENYQGRLVMVTENDPAVGLSNGDLGLLWPSAAGQMFAYFERPGSPLARYSPANLPPHETAFASTVHKSQGSEYDSVCVVLPPAVSPLLSREMLYTAVTRARERVHIFGSEEAVAVAVGRAVARFSGLAAALSAELDDDV